MPQAKKSTGTKTRTKASKGKNAATSAADQLSAKVHKELELLKKKVAAAQKQVQVTTSRHESGN